MRLWSYLTTAMLQCFAGWGPSGWMTYFWSPLSKEKISFCSNDIRPLHINSSFFSCQVCSGHQSFPPFRCVGCLCTRHDEVQFNLWKSTCLFGFIHHHQQNSFRNPNLFSYYFVIFGRGERDDIWSRKQTAADICWYRRTQGKVTKAVMAFIKAASGRVPDLFIWNLRLIS